MSLLVTLAADALVATLLVATILTSVRLSRRIAGMKANEAEMRQTIGDLVVASATAERAIAGLRAALDECDRGLAERIEAAGQNATELARHVEAGEAVVARIAQIVAQAGGQAGGRAPAAERDVPLPVRAEPVAQPAVPVEPVALHRPRSTNERLDAALAAAQAMSDRALARVRAKAA